MRKHTNLRLLGTATLGLAIAFSFSACGVAPTTPVWKYQTILIAPDSSLLPLCAVQAPPSVATYLAAPVAYTAGKQDREDLVTAAYNGQTANIGLCNKEIARVNAWVAKQKLLYPSAVINNGETDLGGASAPTAASAP